MLTSYISIALTGFFSALIFVYLFKKFALRFKIFLSQRMPLVGGIAMGLAFTFASIFGFLKIGGLPNQATAVIISSILMLLFGILDDCRDLSVIAKILVQVIAASLLIFLGVKTQIVYIGDIVNIAVTIIWILAITNALNHLDIMDGLAAGTSVVISLAFFTLAILNGDTKAAILSLSLGAVSLGCLVYNFPPAKIYMGNTGSHFLGFVLAAIAINIGHAPIDRKVALLSPILLLGFPIFDTFFLVLSRLGKKRLPFKKSNDHIALRMLNLGYSKRKTLLYMLGLNIFFCVCAITVSLASNLLGLVIIAAVAVVSLLITREMSKVTIDV